MIGVGDLLDVLMREFTGAAIDKMAQIARIDKQDLVLARVAVVAGAVHEPQRCRDLGV